MMRRKIPSSFLVLKTIRMCRIVIMSTENPSSFPSLFSIFSVPVNVRRQREKERKEEGLL